MTLNDGICSGNTCGYGRAFSGPDPPPSSKAGPQHCQNFGPSYMGACNMRNSNQILHDDQTRREENIYRVDYAPLPYGEDMLLPGSKASIGPNACPTTAPPLP